MKKLVLRILSFMMLVGVTLLAACGNKTKATNNKTNEPSQTQSQAKPVELALDKSELNLNIFDSAKLTATVQNTEEAVVFTSSDQNVVTVDASGNVTVVGVGNATITAAVADVTKTCTVTVGAPEEDIEVYVEIEEISGFVGANQTLQPLAVYGEEELSGATFTYTVDDTTVATVSTDGTVALLKKGEAVITVAGTYKGVTLTSATVTVSVDDKVELVGAPTANVDLYTFAGLDTQNPKPTTYQIGITAKVNGVETDTTFTYATDDDCVTVSTSGLVETQSFGHALITVSATINEKEVNATFYVVVSKTEVEIEGPAKLGFNKGINLTALGINDAITALSVGGTATTFEETAGVLTFSTENLKSGDAQTIVIDTENASYKFTTDTFEFEIASKADFDAFYTACCSAGKDTGKYLRAYLTADIDYNNEYLLNGTNPNSPTITGAYFCYYLDGCGHVVRNMKARNAALINMWGESAGVPQAVIKNIAFINIVKDQGNGGGILFNEAIRTTIDNVYVQAVCTTSAGLVAGLAGNGALNLTVKNSLICAEFASACPAVTFSGTDKVTASNVYAISKTSNGFMYDKTGTDGLFTSAAELKAAVTTLPEGFNPEYWELKEGVLTFKSAYNYLKTVDELTINEVADSQVVIGGEFNLQTNVNATFTLKEAVEGITINGNKVQIAETVATGTKFTVVATYVDPLLGYTLTGETAELTAINSIKESLGTKVQIAKNRTSNGVSEDLTEYEGLVVQSVTFGGKAVNYTFESGILTVAQSDLTENVDAQQLLIAGKIGNDIYALSRDYQVLTMVIGTVEEMNAFKTNINAWSPSKKAVYILFDNDIDMSAAGDWGITHWVSYGGAVINGVIDGQGHVINGLRITLGFTGIGENGTLRNIAFTNVKKSGNGVGTLGIALYGHLENVYVEGTMNENPAQTSSDYAPVISKTYPTASITNCVFYIRGFVSSHNPGVAAFSVGNAGDPAPKFTNTYVICGGKCNAMYAGVTEGLYADYASFMEVVPTIKDNFSSDYWTVVNGALVMKSAAAKYKLSLTETDAVTTTEAYTAATTPLTANFPVSKYELVEAVEGVSINGANLVVSADCQAAKVTVKAYLNEVFGLGVYTTKEITIVKTVSLNTNKVVGKNEESTVVTYDLTAQGVTEISKVSYAGTTFENFTFDATNKTLTFDAKDFASSIDAKAVVINAKAGENILVLTDNITVCDYAIGNKATFIEFLIASSSLVYPNQSPRKYGVLVADIDCENANLQYEYCNGATSYTNQNLIMELDGRGHQIKNANADKHGIFTFMRNTDANNPSIIRNVAFINFYKSSTAVGSTGLMCNEWINVTVENCYFEGHNDYANPNSGGFLGASGSAALSGVKIVNCVINTSVAGASMGAVAPFKNGVTLDNTYVICSKAVGLYNAGGAATDVPYADAAAFFAANVELGGSFEQKEDGLYFYGYKVLEVPAVVEE